MTREVRAMRNRRASRRAAIECAVAEIAGISCSGGTLSPLSIDERASATPRRAYGGQDGEIRFRALASAAPAC